MPEAAALAFASGCFLIATLALKQIWQRRPRRQPFAALTVLSLTAGTAGLVATYGAELGIPIAFGVASPVALAVVFWGRTVRKRAAVGSSGTESSAPSTIYRDAARVFAASLLPAIPAVAAAVATARFFPAEAVTRVVVAAYVLPVVWAGVTAWAASTARFRSVMAFSIGTTAIGIAAGLPMLAPGR